MSLPETSVEWPPREWVPYADQIRQADAWYSGDPTKLAGFYGKSTDQGGAPKSIVERVTFWRRNTDPGTIDERLHMPAADDIASTAADLLLGEDLTMEIAEAHGGGETGTETTEGAATAKATEMRLSEIDEADGVAAKLLEAAELGSALGGVFLQASWDVDVADHPILSVVHPDMAVPEFRRGYLSAVTFWRILEGSDSMVTWRHLERHEPGVVSHGLYAGNAKMLGVQQDLRKHPETATIHAQLAAFDGLTGVQPNPEGIKGLLVEYVPNALPNRLARSKPVGRSDYAQCEGLMDQLDSVWTSLARDVDLGKARIIVPSAYLEGGARGAGKSFDEDRRVFVGIDMPLDISNPKATIEAVQPDIRVEAHLAAAAELFERIIGTAGYSPQSFGMKGDGATITATEVDAKGDKSDATIRRKRRYWTPAMQRNAYKRLVIDRVIFSRPTVPMQVRVVWPGVDTNMREMASTLNLLTLAEAVSTETKVAMLHPSKDLEWQRAEAERIKAEKSAGPPSFGDPTGGAPDHEDPAKDEPKPTEDTKP